MNLHKSIIALTLATTLGSSVAFSLPDARSGNPLSELGIKTPSGIGDVVSDHENPNTLHVGPASQKEITGVYSELDSSGALCKDLINIRSNVFAYPNESVIEEVFQSGKFVSNAFQLGYAINRRNTDSIKKLTKAWEEVRQAGKENAAVTSMYFELNGKWQELNIQLSALNEEKEEIKDKSADNNTNCISLFGTNPTALIKCIQDNAIATAAEKAQVDQQISVVKSSKNEIADDYFEAKAQYEAVANEIELINADIGFLTLIMEAQFNATGRAHDFEQQVLSAEDGKIAGRATAGYNLFGDETTRLSRALVGHGSFQVKQLDVFNVRLNTGVTLNNPSVATSNGRSLYSKNLWSFPASTLLRSNLLSEWSTPFERKGEGDTILFDTMDINSFASGGVSFLVTKGARCGGYKAPVTETYTVSTRSGDEVSWSARRVSYEPEPKPNHVVFSESIGLTYDYYAYPGPLRGECSIDVDRMHSYWRTSGKSKSWRWFKTKTRSWDQTRQEARDKMGMVCSLDIKPVTNDPVEARNQEAEFEQHMYSDMWQMFLSVYAKEYKVEVLEPDVTDPGKSTVGNTLGTGLMKLCGANVYCQFTGVVLKALDEIGGSKASGTTSSTSRTYGKIWKRYDKNSFAVKQGSSSINMKVCVDRNKCS